ncbi:hypothetical protein [uncultured Thiodictyon sp.]|uniref:hypothetical protein n=1 Tax=uncultured Thiodictyon sp. TaxID=1846217 RepID=UPI0025D204E3|nr:hypothetical protein [uncultured Thiodictyon sp.]
MANYQHFSRYLFSFRIRHGFESTSEFLDACKVPMSDNYYRDVEAGRKLPTMDKAIELFQAMPFGESDDRYEFFWHYLKEILPEDVQKNVLMPRVDTSFERIKDSRELLEYDLRMHREAAAIARFAESHLSSDDEIAYISEAFDLMPLLHYIHMVDCASEQEIRDVCNKNDISATGEEIDRFFAAIGVQAISDNGEKRYVRSKPIFRVPRNIKGLAFKDRFTTSELIKSFEKKRAPEKFDVNATFDYSTIVAISAASQERLSDRLRDLISEISVSERQLDDPTATPFFIAILISGRHEYKPG